MQRFLEAAKHSVRSLIVVLTFAARMLAAAQPLRQRPYYLQNLKHLILGTSHFCGGDFYQ